MFQAQEASDEHEQQGENSGRLGCSCHPGYLPAVVEDTVISLELEPPTVEAMAHRIESTLLKYPYMVAERDGHFFQVKLAGYGLRNYTGEC